MYIHVCIYAFLYVFCGDWIGTRMSTDKQKKTLQRYTKSNKAASIQKRYIDKRLDRCNK